MTALTGKVAVVIGAARGIGRAAAVALAKADVVGIDVAGPVSSILDFAHATAEELADTRRTVEAAGRRWLAVTLDQRDRPALRDAAAKAVEEGASKQRPATRRRTRNRRSRRCSPRRRSACRGLTPTTSRRWSSSSPPMRRGW